MDKKRKDDIREAAEHSRVCNPNPFWGRIAIELLDEVESLETSNSIHQTVILGLRKRIKEDHPGIGLKAIANAITAPLDCGHPNGCCDDETGECRWCADIKEVARLEANEAAMNDHNCKLMDETRKLIEHNRDMRAMGLKNYETMVGRLDVLEEKLNFYFPES